MKMTGKNTSSPVEQACIGSNHQGEYYALIKKGGKKFRRSLRTEDQKPATQIFCMNWK
jgi:hypothetical protein